LPLTDQVAFASAHLVYVLSARPGGHTWSLVTRALSGQATAGRLHVWVPNGTSEETSVERHERQHAQRLIEGGAVGWYLVPDSKSPAVAGPTDFPAPSAPISRLQPGDARDFLAHHTRRSAGAFPEEQPADYWWRWLMFDSPGSTPVDVLLRIVCQRRLRAAGHLIPGQVPAVCFSARCPLAATALRTFRPHLRRWDYEPYGVAIDRAWLVAAGARPVEYLEASEPATPFQQIRYSGTQLDLRVDWSEEQEYRLLGDLDLRRIPPGRLFWFVATRQEAWRIAAFTHQPVKYLQADQSD
jgi:hypothetical protein